MAPLWRGFAGLVVVFFLAFYITRIEEEVAEEKAMVYGQVPEALAANHYAEGIYQFHEVYFRRIDPNTGADIGYWILVGDQNIPQTLLENYPNRIKIEGSLNYGYTEEGQSYKRRLHVWVRKYNLKMAELLAKR